MTRELVDRMRTCAAAIKASQTSGNPWDLALLGNDAARLLTEAAEALDAAEPIGEPMALIQPDHAPRPPPVVGAATWGGDLPIVATPPCPSCGSIDARKVTLRGNRRPQVTCPVCSNVWEY